MSMRLFVWFSLLACLFPAISAAAPSAPVSLRVEYLTSPLGIDVAQPRFSWVLPQDGRGQKQTAYQVVVASGSQPYWDSGKVDSAQSTGVIYAGPPLASGAAYSWKVRWWDKDGTPSPYSAAAAFAASSSSRRGRSARGLT